MATAVGFIGLGTMGKPMATNLVKAGFDVTVFDLLSEPVDELKAMGATAARSPSELASRSEIIELAVPDDAAVVAALMGEHGALNGARKDTIILVHSTIHPNTIRKVAAAAEAKGVHALDVQMSGGQDGAKNRTLCFMAGGR